MASESFWFLHSIDNFLFLYFFHYIYFSWFLQWPENFVFLVIFVCFVFYDCFGDHLAPINGGALMVHGGVG
jgi:hypothetical protein